MQKKPTSTASVPQESTRSLTNADERRHTQEHVRDTASPTDTQRYEEQKSHKLRQPKISASRNDAGDDDRVSPDVTSASTRDVPSDDEFAAEASGHAQADEPQRSCSEIMSKDPVYCVPSDAVDVIARLMVTEDIGAIPVVHDLRKSLLIGIVTDRDLVVKVVAEGHDPQAVTIGEVMTQEPIACRADSNVQAALDAMAEHQLRRIPIVDEHHRLVGIIAQADVAARLARPAETARVVEEISQSNVEPRAADRK
jgi:CBS domain-containing protein